MQGKSDIMTENQKNFYKLVLKIALTYRLSLDNVCLLIGKKPTEENKKNIYYICMQIYEDNFKLKSAYKYLFNFETVNEPYSISKKSFLLASMFFEQYKLASKQKDFESIKKLNYKLIEVDDKFSKLKAGEINTAIPQDITTISKYRLKYAISRKRICEYLDVALRTFINKENEIQDEKLKYKLKLLSEYYYDLVNNDKRNVK